MVGVFVVTAAQSADANTHTVVVVVVVFAVIVAVALTQHAVIDFGVAHAVLLIHVLMLLSSYSFLQKLLMPQVKVMMLFYFHLHCCCCHHCYRWCCYAIFIALCFNTDWCY